MDVTVQRIAAFAEGEAGGNPAGVALLDRLPEAAAMQRIAAEIGYSETAFLAAEDGRWRVRYFAPAMEVPFCGHATIASGAALGAAHGAGVYPLLTNAGAISVEAMATEDGGWTAALQSPPTRSGPAPEALSGPTLQAFGLTDADLDPDYPIRLAEAGARHLVVALADRARLAAMSYPFEPVKALMEEAGLITINLLWRESERLWQSRNAFAAGGVVEDPATGAAAAAFAGYLRDLGALPVGPLEIRQGVDMGAPCRLTVETGATPGDSVRVSGRTRVIDAPKRFEI